MALINCPECNKEVSNKADACPNCGNPINISAPGKRSLNLKTNSGCLNAFLVLVAALIIYLVLPDFGANSSVNNQPKHDKAMAWQITQKFVKEKIKSPSTAVFPKYYDIESSILKENRTYTITTYVDAENSFGANLRQNFEAVVKYDGNNNWILMKLVFE